LIALDTSAFVAIFQHEPEAERYAAAVETSPSRVLSAGNYLECAMVASRRSGGRAELDAWLGRFSVEVVPVDLTLAQLAADAFARYGRGRHPANLNYGDCFAYALAKRLGAALLYKGDDFARTDIRSALAAG
jgi:ribonuclease VapC